ncbi:hypothetical protein [Longimonas halophila]|uniref:hypothetical protein n=1 Tax=Longimonas halophila TaxID=1469170 RepID=UPI001143B6FF|nr:hypothetical protein [Longimonas halophila]
MIEDHISHLASSINWWSNYKSAVGRNCLFSEGVIKFPATEYLETMDEVEIHLEYMHPKFRMKRLDIHIKDKDNEEECTFEFKYIRDGSTRTT